MGGKLAVRVSFVDNSRLNPSRRRTSGSLSLSRMSNLRILLSSLKKKSCLIQVASLIVLQTMEVMLRTSWIMNESFVLSLSGRTGR